MKILTQFSFLILSGGILFSSETLAGATKTVNGLAVMARMGQAAFAQDERVGLTVTVKNTTANVVRLNATQFLESTTFGRYQFAHHRYRR